MDEHSRYFSALDIRSRFDYSVVDLNTEPKPMQRAVHEVSRSEPPVAIWMALPALYSMNIAGSLAHPAIKKLFELWGSSDGEVSWRGYIFTVDSGDLSVSTEFSNGDRDWCSLSLSGDGLALSITSNGEQSVLTVPADRLDQAELFEDWFPHIQLH